MARFTLPHRCRPCAGDLSHCPCGKAIEEKPAPAIEPYRGDSTFAMVGAQWGDMLERNDGEEP